MCILGRLAASLADSSAASLPICLGLVFCNICSADLESVCIMICVCVWENACSRAFRMAISSVWVDEQELDILQTPV